MIPAAAYPEYRLTLVWRADADGNGVRAYLVSHDGSTVTDLQASWHPGANLVDAVEAAMDKFFMEA